MQNAEYFVIYENGHKVEKYEIFFFSFIRKIKILFDQACVRNVNEKLLLYLF